MIVAHKIALDPNHKQVNYFAKAGGGIVRNRHLASSLSDVGFFELRRKLEYKAKLGSELVVVADRWFPSSKSCSTGRAVQEKMPLAVREW
jgi:putative transposase